jgi:hypothetical protein
MNWSTVAASVTVLLTEMAMERIVPAPSGVMSMELPEA